MTDIATLSVKIQADAKSLDAELKRVQAALERLGSAAPKGDPFAPVTRGAGPARDGVLALAQANARLLATQGDLTGAQETLAAALSRVNVSSTQTIGAQTQLAGIQNRIAKEASGATSAMDRLAGGVGALSVAAGALGLAEVASQIVQFGVGAVQSANELERTQAIMQQLAGTSQRYAEIVKLAEQNQALFGGSLNANLTPLNALLQLSNRTGAELQSLNETSQLLLASSPGKAFEDASFALSEFLSNNGAEAALSLADQFNLNKTALQELATAGTSAGERIAGLNALLAEQGVTAATLAAATSTNAATYAATGAAVDTLRTQLGALLAEGFAPVAAGVGDASTALTGFIVSLTGADSPMAQFQTRLAEASSSYEVYRQAAENSAAGTRVIVDGLIAGIPILAPFSDQIAALAANMGILSQGEYQAATASDARTAAVIEEDRATRQATAATDEGAAAADNDAVAKLAQAAAAEQTAQRHAELEAAIRSAAAGSGDAAAASARIAGQFNGVEAPAVANLINLYRQMAAEKAAATGTKVNNVPASKRLYQSTGVPADALRSQEASRRSQEEMVRVEQARRDQILATGNATQAVTVRQQQYNEAVKQYGANSAEAIRAQTALMQSQEAATRAAAKGGGGGAGAATRGQKAAQALADKEQKIVEGHQQKLADIEERAAEAKLAAQERYEEQRIAIIEKYAEVEQAARESFEQSQLDGRAGFYDSLRGIDDQGIRQRASAAFEAGEAKAGELERTQGADVAEAYREENAKVVQARAQREQEIAKLREDGKKDEAKYLEDVDKLYREAEDRRLGKVAAGEGSADDRKAEELSDAERQRADALAEAERKRQEAIGDAGETAQKRLADAQERTAEKVAATNLELQRQVDLVSKTGGAPALPAAATTAAATSDAATTAAPVAPGAAAGGDALAVRDVDALAALQAVAGQLENIARSLRARPNYQPGG